MAGRPRTHSKKRKVLPRTAVVRATAPEDLGSMRDALGLKRTELARLLGATERSVANWERGAKPGDAHQRSIRQIARILDSARTVMEPQSVGAWLQQPLDALGGLKPLEAIERGEHDRVWRLLFSVESGGFG